MRAASERRRRRLPGPGVPGLVFAALLAAAGFLTAPTGHAVDSELHVIPLKHRLADEVVPVLRPLLADGESVSEIDSRLIVRASPATLAQIRRVLAEVDVARRNLRISVRHGGTHEMARENREMTGDVRHGGTRISMHGGNAPNTGGLRVGRSGPDGEVQLRAEQRITRTQESSEQTLMVLDGGRAFLRVGESIPEVQPFLALVGNRLAVTAGIRYHDVTTGFDVQAQLRDAGARLTIAPRFAFRSNQGMQIVPFQELATTVTVKFGEWIDLGSMVGSVSDVSRQILATSNSERGSETMRLLVRVDTP